MRITTCKALPFLFLSAPAAFGQATENAITDAEDAFGFTNGDESVGIYSERSVRGFNLEAAGNYRINGRYFVKSSGTSSFFLEAKTVRIGYNTFNTHLPGPSGVVDYKLRDPKADEKSLLTTGINAFTSPYSDFLYKHRNQDGSFSAAAGVGLEYDATDHQGGDGSSWLLAGTARLSLSDATKLQFFFGEYSYRRQGQFRVRTDGTFIPREIKRGEYLGQEWAQEKGERRITGLLWDHETDSGWQLGGIAVFSQEDPTEAYTQIFTLSERDGNADTLLVTSPHQKFTAWSGEITLGRDFKTGNLRHKITAHGRLRFSRNRFGGEDFVDLGAQAPGAPTDQIAAAFNENGTLLRDTVDQWGAGLSYQAVWANRLQLTAGVLRSDYEKSFKSPVSESTNNGTPWLYNVGISGRLTPWLDLYGSYSRGLEEAGTAPASASNPNQVLSAIIVTQRELGIKATLAEGLNLVLAGFDTRKPYAGLDTESNIYGLFGKVRHRGIEASLSGQIADGLSIVIGGVLMDAELSGDAVDAGLTGNKPVAVPTSRFIANVNYTLPSLPNLSVDAGLTTVGKQAASSRLAGDEQLMLRRQTTVDAGFRYKLKIGKQDATLRFQVKNLFNSFAWKVSSAETFDYLAPRRFRFVLTTEF